MTEDVARLVREIRRLSGGITSLVVDFRSQVSLQLMPIQAYGRIHFLSPDKFRSETMVNGKKIITIRSGTSVHRYLPSKMEVWKYDLKDLPQTEPLNLAIADLRNPFILVDEANLEYSGILDESGAATHAFKAPLKNWEKHGLLDTRKGFILKYQPKGLEYRLCLLVDTKTGLLRKLTGTDKTDKQVLEADYTIESTNIPMDESMFALNESTAPYKTVRISEILISGLNPDAADAAPSMN